MKRNEWYFKRIPKPNNEQYNSEDTDDFADNFNNRNPATPRVCTHKETFIFFKKNKGNGIVMNN